MHELAIVEDLMNTVQDSALEHNLKIVKKVKVKTDSRLFGCPSIICIA